MFEQLSQSNQSFDRDQLEIEQKTFDEIRRIELMNNLIKKEQSLSSQSIFDTELVDSLLSNRNHYHYFYKYFSGLSSIYGIHFDREFYQAFKKNLEKQSDSTKTVDKGFQLYEFLYNYGRYDLARQTIETIVQFLTKQVKQQQQQPTTVWTYLFRACCALIQVHNQGLEMKEAWARIEAANEIAENLKTTGIGILNSTKKNKNESFLCLEISDDDYAWFYFAASQTAVEDANFDANIQYCYR